MDAPASGDEISVEYRPRSPQAPEAAILRKHFSVFEQHADHIDFRGAVHECGERRFGETRRPPVLTVRFSHRACRLVAVGRRRSTLEAVTVYIGWLQRDKVAEEEVTEREDVFIVHYAGFPIPNRAIDGLESSGIDSFYPLEERRHDIMPESIRVPRAQLETKIQSFLAVDKDYLYDTLYFFKRTPSQRIVTKFLATNPSVQRAAAQLTATKNREPVTGTVPVLCYDSKDGGQCRVLLSGYFGDAVLLNERIKFMLTPESDVLADVNGHCRLLPGYIAPAGTPLIKVAQLNCHDLIDDSKSTDRDCGCVGCAVLHRDCMEKLAFYGRNCNADMNAVNAAVNVMPIPPTYRRLCAALKELDEAKPDP